MIAAPIDAVFGGISGVLDSILSGINSLAETIFDFLEPLITPIEDVLSVVADSFEMVVAVLFDLPTLLKHAIGPGKGKKDDLTGDGEYTVDDSIVKFENRRGTIARAKAERAAIASAGGTDSTVVPALDSSKGAVVITQSTISNMVTNYFQNSQSYADLNPFSDLDVVGV
jgi:hypothetical protein